MNTLQSRLNNIESRNKQNLFEHEINKITRKGTRIITTSPFRFKSYF